MSLKWELARRKREHDNLTQSQVKERQSSSLQVPYDAISPCSKKTRFENMRDTIHRLKSKVEYFSRKIERLSTCDRQNKEIGQLVSSICATSIGKENLHSIYAEANDVKQGLGKL